MKPAPKRALAVFVFAGATVALATWWLISARPHSHRTAHPEVHAQGLETGRAETLEAATRHLRASLADLEAQGGDAVSKQRLQQKLDELERRASETAKAQRRAWSAEPNK
jgi:hypothetical protein